MLKGNKALVTGASRGIGFAIAQKLAENGCRVVITGRKRRKAESGGRENFGYCISDGMGRI